MADEKNEPSAQTKALLERTRAAKAKAGENKPVVTVIEDAKPVNTSTSQPDPAVDAFKETIKAPDASELGKLPDGSIPPSANVPEFTGKDPNLYNTKTVNDTAPSNDELKAVTRTMSRTEAERERGRQIVQKNEEARERAQANRRREEAEERKLRDQYEY